ncbi:MAG: peptidase C39 family protein [Microcella sp.]|uniref:peptidase C39 family protein n=1 Tax=Microcella sp. TaxID=1913979 RepID=UPI0024CAD05C|nr:peptidase C39 family protein [Microcella sp.]UYN84097.1 MAG: peptidase C39 family protein [Microcella sp.]
MSATLNAELVDVALLEPTVPASEQQPELAVPASVSGVWMHATGSAIVHRALLGEPSDLRAAALLRRRPHTAGSVIVGAFGDAAALAVVIERLVQLEREAGHPLLRWQVLPGETVDPAAHGFRPLTAARPSGDGTEPGIDGWVLDLVDWPRGEIAYYRQTTEFTCGGVSALLALEAAGITMLGDDVDANRLTELRVWRSATNVPACDPLALTATLERLRGDGQRVEVYLDADDAVLLEHLTAPDDLAFRGDLQRLAAIELEAAGVARHSTRPSMADIGAAVEAGAIALLLIDLEPLIDDPTPHWVVAASAREGVLLIDDPWVETSIGETWVMTHELPITADELEGIVRWGSGYRGVILLHP